MIQYDVHSNLPARTLGSPLQRKHHYAGCGILSPARPALLAAQVLLFSDTAPRMVPAGLWVPEALVLAVVSWWLPLAAVSRRLCSHGDGVCLGQHHGVVVEGH